MTYNDCISRYNTSRKCSSKEQEWNMGQNVHENVQYWQYFSGEHCTTWALLVYTFCIIFCVAHQANRVKCLYYHHSVFVRRRIPAGL
jgi:hypothetical protein